MNYFLDTILLVDDNEIDNMLNTRLIQSCSFARHVESRLSADDALELLYNEFKIKKKVPELILLDILMPMTDGFDFLESFDTFHENLKNSTKIVMLTSSFLQSDIDRANENKLVKLLLHKPLTKEALENLKKIL